jgi:regulation of enolase protein 1 (concanavalin A-like superfamily)
VALPFALVWLNQPQRWSEDGDELIITAAPRTDWFVNPNGGEPKVNAPALIGNVQGDFLLSKR